MSVPSAKAIMALCGVTGLLLDKVDKKLDWQPGKVTQCGGNPMAYLDHYVEIRRAAVYYLLVICAGSQVAMPGKAVNRTIAVINSRKKGSA